MFQLRYSIRSNISLIEKLGLIGFLKIIGVQNQLRITFSIALMCK